MEPAESGVECPGFRKLHLGYSLAAPTIFPAPKPVINDARFKVMGFGAGKTMPKTTIGARLYPSYDPGYACFLAAQP